MDWSQSELARQTKLTSAAINAIEQGNRQLSLLTLQKLSRLFNITIDELVNEPPRKISDRDAFFLKFNVFEKLTKKDQELLLMLAKKLHK